MKKYPDTCGRGLRDHFTMVCLVTWPLNESETGVDLVLIETSLLFLCKFILIKMQTAPITYAKQGSYHQTRSTPASHSFKSQATKYNCKWFIASFVLWHLPCNEVLTGIEEKEPIKFKILIKDKLIQKLFWRKINLNVRLPFCSLLALRGKVLCFLSE